jgi:dipeptidyl aminopeptidase/acylaminoacyl peptidase
MGRTHGWGARLAGGVALGVSLTLAPCPSVYAQPSAPEREEAARRYLEIGGVARQGVVELEWLADGSSFRFRPSSEDATEWRVYDPYSGRPPGPVGTEVPEPPSVEREQPREVGRGEFGFPMFEIPSPDGSWFAHRREHDLWLRRAGSDELVPLTDDGVEDAYWGEAFEWDEDYGRPWAWWSPDATRLAVKKRDERQLPVATRFRFGAGGAGAETERRSLVGDPLPTLELFLFDVADGTRVRAEDGSGGEQYVMALGWSADGSEFRYVTLDRAHRRLRLLAADAVTGAARTILEERRETYHSPLWNQPPAFVPLSDGRSFLWVSDRDGYRHLYRFGTDGAEETKLTSGSFPIQDVIRVDEPAGWVYVTGRPDQARPYDLHLLRARLDGSGIEQLTAGAGMHRTQFSPSGEIFVDTYSSPDRLPTTVVRRRDGSVLDTLATADPVDLETALGTTWVPPEEVVVTATDGTTELHGLLYKPFDFDPSSRYPVIEYIYDAFNTTVVARSFPGVTAGDPAGGYPWDSLDPLALAQLGYLVWVVDGPGSALRGRSFREAALDEGYDLVAEHIEALRQVAQNRPYMDVDRAGIFGTSAGGEQTLTSLLQAPDMYRVGVAIAAPADPRLTPADLEFLLGPPDENPDAYEPEILESVSRLKGDLLIVQGTDDPVVPIDHALRLVEALVAAGRPHDLLLLPGEGHSIGPASASYTRNMVWRYFLEHLPPGGRSP